MWRRYLLVVALVACTPVFLHAQSSYENTRNQQVIGFGVGPVLGIYKARDADNMNFTGGLAARLKLGPALGVEGSITYRQESYASGAATVRTWPVMVTGLIYPLPIVYGAIGAGWYNTTIDYDQSKFPVGTAGSATQQKFGWHFGAGVELPMGGSSLVADIRYVFLNYDFKTLPGTGGTNSDFYVISVGWLFGL